MRECCRRLLPTIADGWDIILVARPPIRDLELEDVLAAVAMLLERSPCLKDRSVSPFQTPTLPM